MYTILLNGADLTTIIMSLEIEAYRIKEYYSFMIEHNVTEMSKFDKERLANIDALTEELKRERGH
jgi:uncharacterized phage-like protein YoqJ